MTCSSPTPDSDTQDKETLPGLSAANLEPLVERVRALGWLSPDEAVVSAKPAGEGNMNLTLRLRTDRRSLIVKHARPWVEKYPQVPAPVERIEQEHRFYQRVRDLPAVAARMPELLGFDGEARLLAISDLGEASDLTGVYRGQRLSEEDLAAVAAWAAKLHAGRRGEDAANSGSTATLTNRAMRQLNHAHIFEVPWQPGAVAEMGLDLDPLEPGLADAARELQRNEQLVAQVRDLGQRYLADGPCLLHGDLFPGSFLRTESGIFAIDPEFGHYGQPEFDIGVWFAHLALAEQGSEAAKRFLDRYRQAMGDHPVDAALDEKLAAGYAGCEVIRRLIGVAQLPIPPSDDGRRIDLLNRAAATVRSRNLQDLMD